MRESDRGPERESARGPERERKRGGSHRFHRGQLHWYSLSPDVSYYGGIGVQAGCHHMGG